jgi:hypothetical protein
MVRLSDFALGWQVLPSLENMVAAAKKLRQA